MSFCPQCGNEISDGDVFCAFCGAELDAIQTSRGDVEENPFAVGAQTLNPRLPNETESREVPTNIFAAIKMCFTQRRAKGRSSRAEFWYWNIFVFFTVVLPFYAVVMPYGGEPPAEDVWVVMATLIGGIVVAKPTSDVAVRRFHDVGLVGISAYALLLLIFPGFLLVIFMFYFWFLCFWICLFTILIVGLIPGTKGPNEYGPPPVKRKAAAEDKMKENEVSR